MIEPAAWGEFGRRGRARPGGVRLADRGLLPDQPDQPRLGGDGRVQRAVRRRRASSGRPAPMAELWTGTIWPVTITVVPDPPDRGAAAAGGRLPDLCRAQGDRRHAAAPGADDGRARSACCSRWPTASSCSSRRPSIPTGANKVVFLMAPMVTFILALIGWAVIPFGDGHGAGRHQCRRALPVRDQLARRLRHHHGRLGQQLALRLPGRAAQLGADGQLRDRDRPDHPQRAGHRGLAQSVRHRAGAADGRGSSSRTSRCS